MACRHNTGRVATKRWVKVAMNAIIVVDPDENSLLQDVVYAQTVLEESFRKILADYFRFGRALLEHQEYYGGYGWTTRMAEHTGLSTKTINRACQLVEQLGDHEKMLVDSDLQIGTLYKLAASGSDAIRVQVLDDLEDGQELTDSEIAKRQLMANLEFDDPTIFNRAVCNLLRDDAITVKQATDMVNAGKEDAVPSEVLDAIVNVPIPNKHLWPHLIKLYTVAPDMFDELVASGSVYVGPTGEIPLGQASVTDLALFVREVEAEAFVAWLETIEEFKIDEDDKRKAKHKRSVRGNRAALHAAIDTLHTEHEDRLFAVFFELPED